VTGRIVPVPTTATLAATGLVVGTVAVAVSRRLRPTPRLGVDLADPLLRPPVTAPEVRTVTSADGTDLHVELHGPVDAPALVLSHGWTCSTQYWNPQVHAFAGAHRVITYDQRGHGRSEAWSGRLSPDTLAEDLAAVLEATLAPGRRAVLVGHSMGAMSVVAWAGRHPEQVRRRVGAALLASTAVDGLVAGSMLFRLPTGHPRLLTAIGRAVLTAPTPVLAPSPLSHRLIRYAALSPSATEDQVSFCEQIVLDCPPRVRSGWGDTLRTLDLRAAVASLTVPTTVLVGTADRLTPPPQARALAATLREHGHLERLVELPGVGHMSTVEAPAAAAAEIRHLLERS
jgi:pimeloyl-ACP methyl ester carboxylesterase